LRYIRPYKRSWFSYQTQQPTITTNFKPTKSKKTMDESSNLPTITIYSIPIASEIISNRDSNNGYTASPPSLLTVA